jgi:ABC-type thiamin/hydroxymethylpyrimidine transport system permease subunit
MNKKEIKKIHGVFPNIIHCADQNKEYTSTSQFMAKNTIFGILTLKDLLVAAILGIMGGFISSLVPFALVIKVFYPFMGGTQLMSGHHVLWMAIAYGLTRKKSAPLITAFIKGIIEALLGDAWGAFIIAINLLEGTVLVLGFMLMEKFNEGDTNLGWAIAGGLGNFSQAPVFWALTGKFVTLHYSLAILSLSFAFISGVFITGLLGRGIVYLFKKAEGDT